MERRKYLHVLNSWPRFFYKFRAFPSEDRLRSLIVKGEIYLSSPRDFNDPFDMRGKIVIKGGFKALRRKLSTLPIGEKMRRTALRDARVGVSVEGLEGYVTRMFMPIERFDELIGRQGVHCFASRTQGDRLSGPRSNLMWSHYGDSHKGFCLQYAVHEDPILVQAARVKYASQYPIINWLSDHFADDVLKCVTQKDECWKYESEWRYVKGDSARQLISLNRRALKSVILGAEAQRSDIDSVVRLVEERLSLSGVSTDVYIASRSPDKYRVCISRLT